MGRLISCRRRPILPLLPVFVRSLPSSRVERGLYRRTGLERVVEQSIGKRACHHSSGPIGRLARRGGGAVTSLDAQDRPLATTLWSLGVSFPSQGLLIPTALSSSSLPAFSSRAPTHAPATTFSSLFRAAKSATRRTHVPLRAVVRCCTEQRRCVLIYTSANLNTSLRIHAKNVRTCMLTLMCKPVGYTIDTPS